MKNKHPSERRSDCPISFGLDIFGDKWTLLIIRDILFYQRTRFSDFALQEHIATNILANRLSRLEKAGIIIKSRDRAFKNQAAYTLTKKGVDLLPTLIEMSLWGLQYDMDTPISRRFIKRIKQGKQQVIGEITQAVKDGSFIAYRQEHMGISDGQVSSDPRVM